MLREKGTHKLLGGSYPSAPKYTDGLELPHSWPLSVFVPLHGLLTKGVMQGVRVAIRPGPALWKF